MLTSRQLTILKAIIESYAVEHEPIGSKRIADMENINASSATVRNEMSTLEKFGLISKTHLSSGRVPSTTGYRYYIDHLMEPKEVSESQDKKIHQALDGVDNQIDEIFYKTANVLSELTNYTSIVLGPIAKETVIRNFQFIPLTNNQILAIIQTDKNTVESLVFKAPARIDQDDLIKVANIFNEHLVNQPLTKVFQKLEKVIPILVYKHARDALPVLMPIENIIHSIEKDKQYFISGKPNLLEFASDLDLNQVKSLFELLEEDVDLDILIQQPELDIHVKIGQELDHELFNQLSLFTANYQVGEMGQGAIAILGPLDMPYSKTYGLIDAMREQLTNQLFNRYLK